jgi:hypothetical protein
MSGYDTVACDRALAHARDGVLVAGSGGRVHLWNSAVGKILTLVKISEPVQDVGVGLRAKPGRTIWLPCPAR